MESRFRVHYDGNTVIPPSPGRKRQQKTFKQDGFVFTGKNMTYEPKVCATTRCIWCEAEFAGQFRTICTDCHNCQYCGLASMTSNSVCPNCGNHPDDEIAPQKTVLRPVSTE